MIASPEFFSRRSLSAVSATTKMKSPRKMTSVKEKGHPTNRRLAAVSFLNSISLNGSYKDSCWPYESDKADVPERVGDPPPDLHPHSGDVFTELKSITREDERSSDRNRFGTLPGSGDAHVPSRVRSNTGSFCRARDIESNSTHPKHAHFSSSESLDHAKLPAAANISDLSVNRQNTTIVNLKTDSLPTIKNERLVILVSRRSPLVVFSALPYSRDNRVSRAVDRPELIRRTRNTSGSRPISNLSDPDPLEQLVHFREEEVSYGYLLNPTKTFLQLEQGTTVASGVTVSDEIDHGKHTILSRGYSYDAGGPGAGSGGPNVDNPSPTDAENQEQRHLTQTGFGVGGTGVASGHKSAVLAYSPHMLDDPEFRAGKHRTLLTFPSYITSVIDYCKASDMKKELNDKFKDRFPHIYLTLSKLRSLKREMRRVAKAECNIDLLTVAQAYVYFEKLILGSFVTKHNRKFCAGACLLLSAKLNDVKGLCLHNLLEVTTGWTNKHWTVLPSPSQSPSQLSRICLSSLYKTHCLNGENFNYSNFKHIFQMIERTFRVNRKDLLTFEFAVLVALEFTLHLPTWEVFPHYQRLLYES